MPMLNVRSMSSSGTSPARWSHWKSGGTRHDARSIAACVSVGRTRGQVLGDAAAGDVRHALDRTATRAADG